MAESPVGFPGLFVLESSRMCAQKSPFSPQCYNTKHHLPHCNPSSDFPPNQPALTLSCAAGEIMVTVSMLGTLGLNRDPRVAVPMHILPSLAARINRKLNCLPSSAAQREDCC